jgi:hypothetical protein
VHLGYNSPLDRSGPNHGGRAESYPIAFALCLS